METILAPSLLQVMETLEPMLGGNIVMLNERGAVTICSESAQKYLETFFSTEKPFNNGLPSTLENWVHRELVAPKTNDLAVRTAEPLNVVCGELSLHIWLASTRDRTVYFLVLRVEDPTLQLKKLGSLGLGHRATEVLYWLAKGKTNGEIGLILGARPRTIEKHVEGILAKLGVENRVTAALLATQGRF
jgi:DNA-binding CsgD family transcriptional regulator